MIDFPFDRIFNLSGADFAMSVNATVGEDVISIASVKIGDTEIKQDLPKEFVDKLECEAEYEWGIILKGVKHYELE